MASTINASTSGVGGVITTADASGVLDLQTAGVTRVSVGSSGMFLARTDSASEGGQLSLNRASDDAPSWAVDVFGSTSTPALRFVDSVAGAERAAIDGSGNFKFDSGYGSSATAYGCRAWVNFNGTGTVAIRASGNVSSISDNGIGNYTINFSNAMPDANYTTVATCASDTDGYLKVVALNSRSGSSVNPTTTAQRIYTRVSGTNSDSDSSFVEVSVFR